MPDRQTIPTILEDYADEDFPPQITGENTLRDPDKLIDPAPTIRVLFDYPLNSPVEFAFTTEDPRGWTAAAFLQAVQSGYERIYREEAESTQAEIIPIEQRGWLLNRNETNGRYGIWGHDIDDLVLEGFQLRNGVYHLRIGS